MSNERNISLPVSDFPANRYTYRVNGIFEYIMNKEKIKFEHFPSAVAFRESRRLLFSGIHGDAEQLRKLPGDD